MLAEQDYVQVAQMHIESINQGFLSTLGIRFLALIYRAIDDAETAVLIVEKQNGVIVGFVTGSMGMGVIYKALLRRLPTLIRALTPALVNPKKIWRIFEIIRYRLDSSPPDLPKWELLSIAVSPNVRGSGVAQKLYKSLQIDLKSRGATRFQIVVGEDLAPAHKFYKKMGAMSHTETSVHGRAQSIIYIHDMSVSVRPHCSDSIECHQDLPRS